MAEHTYKPGEEVAVKARYNASPISAIHRHSVIVERGSIEVAYVDDDQLAPFLSVADQDSLLRVVRAAMDCDICAGHQITEHGTACRSISCAKRHAAIGNLSPEILSRARLSEAQ